MKGTNDKNLTGAFLKSYENKGKPVTITETSGEVTTGLVIGYTRGGYKYGAEQKIREATVSIKVKGAEGEQDIQVNISIANILEVVEALLP